MCVGCVWDANVLCGMRVDCIAQRATNVWDRSVAVCGML